MPGSHTTLILEFVATKCGIFFYSHLLLAVPPVGGVNENDAGVAVLAVFGVANENDGLAGAGLAPAVVVVVGVAAPEMCKWIKKPFAAAYLLRTRTAASFPPSW